MRPQIISLFFLMYFSVIGYSQTLNKDSITTDYIEFGSGGGFTGISHNYLLTKTGCLYSIHRILTEPSTLSYIKTINTYDTRKIFNYIKKKQITSITYNEPGNISEYITTTIHNKKNSLVWSNSNSKTPQAIIRLSTKLYKLL